MHERGQAASVGMSWDLPDHEHRVAPSEDELWDQAGRVDGVMDAGWLEQAACIEHDPELFFPLSPSDSPLIRLAVEVCDGCAVRVACLQAALADPRTAGIWGGTTEADRAAMHESRSRARRATAAW